MNFAGGAGGVRLNEGENTPFAFVDWSVLQRTVIEDGATFMVRRASVGAGQEMEPTGDVALVTCGPFSCTEGSDAPELSVADTATCVGWEPTLDLNFFMADNGLEDPRDSTFEPDPGLDLGWTYTSSLDFTATHDIIVSRADGKSHEAADEPTALVVPDVPAGSPQILASVTDPDADSCGDEGKGIGSHPKPEECFRVRHQEAQTLLKNYTVTLTADPAEVRWGRVEWKALEELECAPVTFAAADQLDVCEAFAEEIADFGEVEHEGTSSLSGGDLFVESQLGAASDFFVLEGLNLSIETPEHRRFTAMYYTQGDAEDDHGDLYFGRFRNAPVPAGDYGTVEGKDGEPRIDLIDDDGDPIYGDFGKTDHDGDDRANNFASDADSVECSADDGGTKNTQTEENAKGKDGTLCDAEVAFEVSVEFVDRIGLGCEETMNYTVTCEWDADGGRTVIPGRFRSDHTVPDGYIRDPAEYLACEVERAS